MENRSSKTTTVENWERYHIIKIEKKNWLDKNNQLADSLKATLLKNGRILIFSNWKEELSWK